MHVQVDLVKVDVADAEFLGAGSRVRQRRLCGFLHDLAQLASEEQLTLAWHHRYLDGEGVSTGLCPG